jgi:hypothetical protein
MRTLLAALLLASVPAAATAGPALALRSGYGVSSGGATKGTTMSDVASAEIPVQLDALWRFGPHFSAGLYYAFGFGRLSSGVSDACAAQGASCSVWTMRVGAEAEWAFTELSPRYVPWIGAGTGWEWARETASDATQTAHHTLSGWEILSLEGGGDVKLSAKVAVGPYLSLRVGQYSKLDGYGVVNKAFHRWLGFGIRGTFDF